MTSPDDTITTDELRRHAAQRFATTAPDPGPITPSQLDPGTPRQPRRWRWVVALLGALLLGATLGGTGVALVGWRIGGDQPAAPGAAADDPISRCQEAVKERLKAPATARFSHESVSEVTGGQRVHGDIDSENGFGALVRNQYTCDLYRLQSGEWHVGSVAFAK